MHIFGDIFYIDQEHRQITQLVTHQVYHNPPAMFTEVLNVPVALESDFVCWLLFIQNKDAGKQQTIGGLWTTCWVTS